MRKALSLGSKSYPGTVARARSSGEKSKRPEMESETPWVSLASLALFKLFNDWQAQGYELPADLVKGGNAVDKVNQVDQNPAGGAANKTKKALVKTEKPLPENPTEKHPVQLLNEMNGPLVYEQTGQSGSPPNCVFTLTVTVNDVPYSGQGKSKKEAKKSAAQSALSSLYNVEYSPQVKKRSQEKCGTIC